jgi:hypothetical protein
MPRPARSETEIPSPASEGGRRSVVFWNCSRLFGSGGSPIEHALTLDDPDSRATAEEVARKVEVMAAVLDAIAAEHGPPVLVGLVEIESSALAGRIAGAVRSASLVDVDSLATDETGLSLDGLNISLLVDTSVFTGPVRLRSHLIDRAFGTRDILEVDLTVAAGRPPLSVFVNHWPSRLASDGLARREAAAHYAAGLVHEKVRFTLREMWDAQRARLDIPTQDEAMSRARAPVLVMGDFNDEVFDASLAILDSTPDLSPVVDDLDLHGRTDRERFVTYRASSPRLLNPFWAFAAGGGSFYRSPRWRTYDQILLSRGLLEPRHAWPLEYVSGSARIFDRDTIDLHDGTVYSVTNRGGKPISYEPAKDRGCSDHFPVLATFDITASA